MLSNFFEPFFRQSVVQPAAIIHLNPEDKDIGRRIVDFFSGLAYGTDGSFEKAAEGIYLLVPAGMSGTTSLMSDE